VILVNVRKQMPRVRAGEMSLNEACRGPWGSVSDVALERYGQGSHLVAVEGRMVVGAFDIEGWVRVEEEGMRVGRPRKDGGRRASVGGVVLWLEPTRWAFLSAMVGSRAPVPWRWQQGGLRLVRYVDDGWGVPTGGYVDDV